MRGDAAGWHPHLPPRRPPFDRPFDKLRRALRAGLGSTSLATDASGAKVNRVLYYPYGETRWTEGTLPTDYQFTGQRAEGFGLYDYHARYYNAAIGRFASS